MISVSRCMFACFVLLLTLPVRGQQSQTLPPQDVSTTPLTVPPPPENATREELEEKGDTLRIEKAYLDSIDYYRAAMKKKDSAVLHNKAGISYFQLYRDRDAKKEYETALKLDKSYAEAYNNLGALYYREQRYGPAVREYRKALRINEANASFH